MRRWVSESWIAVRLPVINALLLAGLPVRGIEELFICLDKSVSPS